MLGQILVECAGRCTPASSTLNRRPKCKLSRRLNIILANMAMAMPTFPSKHWIQAAAKISRTGLQNTIKKMEAA